MPSIIEIILSATDNTSAGFTSARANLQAFQAGTQQMVAGARAAATAQTQQASSTRTLTTLQERQSRITRDIALASTDAAGKVRIWREEEQRLAAAARQTTGSLEQQVRAQNAAADATLRRIRAENVQSRGLGPALPRTLEEFGTGAIAQLGIGFAASQIGAGVVNLTKQSVDLAIQTERIGTAYEESTRRAGIAADEFMAKLKAASRGTIEESELQLRANQALALGVGQDIGQIADLLAIARQRGKAFGIDTNEAFESMIIGIGRGSTEWLDNIGIVLDSQKVYEDQAKKLGITVDQLTKQQKITAVTNEVLRTNSDLVQKNADAQIDSADRVAAAEVRRRDAERRFGTQVAPLYIGALEGIGAGAEAITGGNAGLNGSSAQNFVANLAKNSKGYGDFQRKRQDFIRGNLFSSDPGRAIAALQVMTINRSPEEYAAMSGADSGFGSDPRAPAVTGTPMPRLAGATGPYANLTVNHYHVQGSVVTEREIANNTRSEMLRQQQRSGDLGIGTGRRR